MEFDEIQYLEKTVEETNDREETGKSKKGGTDRSYRRREVDEEEEELRKGKRSRVDVEENGSERSGRDRDRDRHRRDRERDKERDRNARDNERDNKERERDRDRERNYKEKERSKRDREKEKEKEKARDGVRDSKENGREKEKDREGYRERESEREKEREGHKERESEREKDKERREKKDRKERVREDIEFDRDARERSRSSSRPRRDSDRERERDFETREGRKYKDKKDIAELELDPERDQKTVFAYQMPLKATERDVYEFFSKAGKVRDVRLIMDRNSRRSKGVGYIEFYDPMAVPMAIALSGQLLLGQPVMVKPSEAEKNLVQSNASSGGAGGAGIFGPVDRKLYVGNLHFNMTELQLRQIFEPYGIVELVQMPLDLETGHCKGFGFVQFASVESAKMAQSELNGKLEIAGRYIKISSVTEHGGQLDNSAKNTDLDDDEGGGMALNAQSRAMLMQKLDRTGTAASIVGALGMPMLNSSVPSQPMITPASGQPLIGPTLPAQPSPYEAVGQPSECLLLKNMFDPATETEPDFDLEIKEDVEAECSKYGRVKHIHVDRNSAGFVYLRFDSVDAAAKAQRAMHMRWFAQRSISATFLHPREYDAKFSNGR